MQFESLNYRRDICQLKTIKLSVLIGLMFFLTSCGTKKSAIVKVKATPVWFKSEPRFSMRDQTGSPLVHPFFDLAPFGSEKDNSINFFVTTPIESKHYYDIDLPSGRLYRKFSYCEQSDIWGRYEGDVHRPKFAIGVVPRVLDQLGKPQKIMVFGNKKYFGNFDKMARSSQRAKVIGGVIHQFCEKYPCKTRDNWLSSLVLIGVNAEDPRYSRINSLSQLKKKANWNYFKAFMENAFGRTKNGPFETPAYRMVGEVPAKEALRFALKKGHLFKFEEMRKMRESCHKLYDYLWEGSKVVRKVRKETQKMSKEQKKKDDYLFVIESKTSSAAPTIEKRFSNQEVLRKNKSQEELEFRRNKKKYEDFSTFFFNFYDNYVDRYKTCMKFVKPSSLTLDSDRHWYFSFINGFMNLENANFIYRCNKRGWVENSKLSNGKRIFDFKARRNCAESSLDFAFDQVVTVNTGLKRSSKPYYRFIEYDYGVGGTHQKVQSWVKEDGKLISCSETEDKEARIEFEKNNPSRVFPIDLQWKRFTVE
ncbi:MAG: hypothetical protein ACJAT2_001965 [Bacteriovoracaceae bacterium]|jgi:hypothetical protein